MAALTRTKGHVAVYERDPEGDAWLVHIKELDGCQTYGRSLRQAEARITEALAAWLDCEPEELTITPRLPAELAKIATHVSETRCDAAKAASDAGTATAEAARKLERMGLSRRDAAEVIGVSHQRVQQLLAS